MYFNIVNIEVTYSKPFLQIINLYHYNSNRDFFACVCNFSYFWDVEWAKLLNFVFRVHGVGRVPLCKITVFFMTDLQTKCCNFLLPLAVVWDLPIHCSFESFTSFRECVDFPVPEHMLKKNAFFNFFYICGAYHTCNNNCFMNSNAEVKLAIKEYIYIHIYMKNSSGFIHSLKFF